MGETYARPPVLRTADDELRRVGIEVELAGLDVETLAGIVARTLEGHVDLEGPTLANVTGTAFGDHRVELDARSLQERTFLEPLVRMGIEDPAILDRVEDAVVRVASEFVPVEVVTPPIPIDRLDELDVLWGAIRAAGGLGTGASVRYAFGLHFNPDVPAPMDAATIVAHLQAYFLLEDWIVRDERVDWTRRVVPFIDPFPEDYRRHLLSPDYAPDLDELIDDYLHWSPTRNRVLDMLPLFAHLRPRTIDAHTIEGAELVKARPTFHYRLPNCEIESEGWTPARAWNRWVEVERLAADPLRLRSMARAYGELSDLPWRLQRHGWVRRVEREWL